MINGVPKPFLDDEQKTLAHGARLIGRNALHRQKPVTRAQALALLTGTTDLLNHIAAQPRLSATQ